MAVESPDNPVENLAYSVIGSAVVSPELLAGFETSSLTSKKGKELGEVDAQDQDKVSNVQPEPPELSLHEKTPSGMNMEESTSLGCEKKSVGSAKDQIDRKPSISSMKQQDLTTSMKSEAPSPKKTPVNLSLM